ncbi:type I 3-dehydroquinate dehydratase [Thiovibrio frasassiensis]|uniref:3-dehydroquinate dehydratase n=1 Tax=Thiovibrio frasassiensis TaxID=2984131 RepID=A0A9X4MFU9_9BACT|nr:type I 3-dehydroquinate dehydratase [Thiovibrio frasassiensis]MDG4475105.1 type I 3-dehydroquinate dehydratase [Thiovibrio frasassiensis]
MLNTTTNAVRRLCVSIAAATPAEALALAKEAEPVADVLEIRLDSMTHPEIPAFLQGINKPLLFTNRPTWEGGNCAAGEPERIDLLKKAAEAGAAYVDIELNAEPTLATELIAAARANNCKSIVSWHDFKCTASRQALTEIFQRQCRSGADIGKIVTTARCFQDVFRVLALQEQAAELGFPLIAFCMGPAGMISRVASTDLGGYMTYAAPDNGPATAPGQLPASSLRRIFTELGHGD